MKRVAILPLFCAALLVTGLSAAPAPTVHPDHSAHVVPPSGDPAMLTHWLNTKTATRHNTKCRYFKKTKQGRMCRPIEGKACGLCRG